MNGLSLLATIISVLSFPIAFLALLYPRIASPKGRWRGFFLYLGISVTTLLLAVLTATGPKVQVSDWGVWDWLVLVLGGGLVLVIYMKKWWRSSPPEPDPSSSPQTHRSQSRNRPKHGGKKKTGRLHDKD